MTPEKAIERAIHALQTGQPNLATTYMRRADQLLVEIREERERQMRESMTFQEVFEELCGSVNEAMQDMVDVATSVWIELRKAMGYAS